jgi:two-component system alkaline phosphatase synthesis response regulator PhoP
MPQKILIVDDERKIAQGLQAYFRQEGYETLTAYDGRQAIDLARRERPDLIVLDLMLPEVDGLEVCRRVRQESSVPIIMLTARVEETDKLVGLEVGADDYVTKPFSPREVVARARAVLRRASGSLQPSTVIRRADVEIDLDRRTVTVGGQAIASLTPTEFDLLATMARQAGRPFSRAQLLDAVQGDAYEGYDRTIDAHIKNLRRKIEPDPANPRYLLTVYGIGYKFAE